MATMGASGSSKKRKWCRDVSDEPRLEDPLLGRLSSVSAVTHSFLTANELFIPPSQSLRLESLLSSLPTTTTPSSSSSTWFHRFVTSAVEEDDPRWYLFFRMSRSTFFRLLSILSPSDSDFADSFAAAIFRLAHGASYKSLLLRFGFNSTADASRAFFTVCKLLHDKLGHLHDPKPDYSPRLLPNCCGVIGFGRFEVNGKLLGTNGGSLLVQALVDCNGRFSHISAGWPSTMNPEAVFRQTKLFTESGSSFLNGAPVKLCNGISVPRYVLGDSSLPLLPWLLVPYSNDEEEDSFESSRREFNNVLHTALHTVDIAFAKVRALWRILNLKWKPETIEFLPFVITTGCLLHNFLLDSGDKSHEEWLNASPADGQSQTWKDKEDEDETRRSQGEACLGSRKIRDAVAQNLSRISSLR